ncbi:MAG: C39 family peptidase [Lautropia sp.]|nr:C39 family peptidase [Lautropia sp.]
MKGNPLLCYAVLAGEVSIVWVMAGAMMSLAHATEHPIKDVPDTLHTSSAESKIAGQNGMGEKPETGSRHEDVGLQKEARQKAEGQRAREGGLTDNGEGANRKSGDQGALLLTQSAAGQVKVKSWKTLRDDGIVKQDLDYSCGAASAATLLNSFYGQNVSEKQFLKTMGEEDGMASFEDMARAMPAFGFKARGFAASWDQLIKLKLPVIVYVKYRKDDHFSVLRGISGNTVWLADPSLGNRTFSKSQFLQMWQTRDDKKAPELAGKFLAVLPAKEDIDRMDAYFSKAPRRQSGVAVEQLSFRGAAGIL